MSWAQKVVLAIIIYITVAIGLVAWSRSDITGSLTAALVGVTAIYVILTSNIASTSVLQADTSRKQAQIMENEQYNSAAPVITLDYPSPNPLQGSPSLYTVNYANIGKGPALNFRCWIEDPQYLNFRTLSKGFTTTAVAVQNDGTMIAGYMNLGVPNYNLNRSLGYLRSQYESVFGITYESCLQLPVGAPRELQYKMITKDSEKIIL